jgi:hypothetical protein
MKTEFTASRCTAVINIPTSHQSSSSRPKSTCRVSTLETEWSVDTRLQDRRLPYVDDLKNGMLRYLQVDPSKLPCLANWTRDNTMETVLIELRRSEASWNNYILQIVNIHKDTWPIPQTRSFLSPQKAPSTNRKPKHYTSIRSPNKKQNDGNEGMVCDEERLQRRQKWLSFAG